MRGEVKALLKRAEEVDEQAAPEIDMPAERVRRAQPLAAIKRAREEIKRRARARFKANTRPGSKHAESSRRRAGRKPEGVSRNRPRRGSRNRGRWRQPLSALKSMRLNWAGHREYWPMRGNIVPLT